MSGRTTMESVYSRCALCDAFRHESMLGIICEGCPFKQFEIDELDDTGCAVWINSIINGPGSFNVLELSFNCIHVYDVAKYRVFRRKAARLIKWVN